MNGNWQSHGWASGTQAPSWSELLDHTYPLESLTHSTNGSPHYLGDRVTFVYIQELRKRRNER